MGNATLIEYDFDYIEPCAMSIPLVERLLRLYIHTVICILGFVGNILVIITYAFYKKAKSMTDVYLLNMSIADLLFVVALPLIIYNEYNHWNMGNVACKILRGVYSINLYSGMLLLACISTDRYIAIVLARRSFRFRSRILLYGRIICTAVWVLALLLSVPTVIYSERYEPLNQQVFYFANFTDLDDAHKSWGSVPTVIYSEHNEPFNQQDDADSSWVCTLRFPDSDTARQMKILVPSTQMAIGFFLPLLVMSFCYSSVIITLLRANFQKHKAVRVVLAVVAVFIACHLPYNVALFYETVYLFKTKLCSEETTVEAAKLVTETVAYLHCCLNPVLYAFIGVRFRNHFRKIISDVWCMGKRVLNNRRISMATSEFNMSTRRTLDGHSCDNASSFTM